MILFQQLREQQIGSVHEVTFAFLEPSGNLSVFTKDDTQPVLALIADGVIQNRHIEISAEKRKNGLYTKSRLLGINDIDQVFYCSFEKGELKFQLKEEFQ